MKRREWIRRAGCVGEDPEIFFRDSDYAEQRAKRVCAECPVRRECLDDALESGDRWGIQGGMTPSERSDEARRRRAIVALRSA